MPCSHSHEAVYPAQVLSLLCHTEISCPSDDIYGRSPDALLRRLVAKSVLEVCIGLDGSAQTDGEENGLVMAGYTVDHSNDFMGRHIMH